MPSRPGPVALAGSGEFLPVMEPVDRALLHGRSPRAAFIPTAAALEGDDRIAYWLDLGRRHFEAMGVEPVPVPVRTRDDAESAEMAALVDGAGLVYLSGGNPHYLAATLRGTALWRAIAGAWASGTALAGCSAGAMALSAGAPPRLLGERAAGIDVAEGHNGLGAIPGLAVIPHFDQMERWRPQVVEDYLRWLPPGTTLVGVDEETALVSSDGGWEVVGERAVWTLDAQGGRTPFGVGERLALPALPA